jgi:cytochrome bd-type quinol oxidase subunit 2
MDLGRRTGLSIALVLILLGAWFLAVQFVPGLQDWTDTVFSWPMIIVGVGFLLLIVGLLIGAPGMAVPACIVGGIGGLLYWQNATGSWGSWTYAWTLIPGFVGLGTVLAGVLGRDRHESVRGGSRLILISLALFVVFGALFGGLEFLGPYWPILLIVLGLVLLVRALVGQRR